MPDPDDLTYKDITEGVERKLSEKLSETFQEVAKTAMRAASEFSVEQADSSILSKLQKAHSVVTLIIDDLMRGLGDATMYAMAASVTSTLQSEYEGESDSETSSPR